MSIPSQETDKIIRNSTTSSSDEIEVSHLPTGTFSSGVGIVYTSQNSIMLVQSKDRNLDLKQKARNSLRHHRNRAQVKQALTAIDNIEKVLVRYEDLGKPEFRISKAPDKSLGISWRFPDALFGVYIQPDTSESSWFLIMGDIDKGLRADGNLDDLDYEIQLSPLFANLHKLYARRGK